MDLGRGCLALTYEIVNREWFRSEQAHHLCSEIIRRCG